MARMTKAQLQAEKEARDAFFRQANQHQANQQPTREDNQTDKLIDRGLVKWWN